MENYLPLFQVLLGGLLATLGGIIGIRLQAKYARKIKMDEVVAEKKVIVSAEAYSHIKKIASIVVRSSLEDALKNVLQYEEWFFSNRLFLPGKFPDKWLSIRNHLARLTQLSKKKSDVSDEVVKLEKRLDELIQEAIKEIYKEMNLEEIKIESVIKERKLPESEYPKSRRSG